VQITNHQQSDNTKDEYNNFHSIIANKIYVQQLLHMI